MASKRRWAGRGGGRSRRARMWLLAVLVALPVAAVTVVAVAFPSVAATTCPACYGLERLAPDVYAEPGLTASQRRQVISVVEEANRRVRDFYGGRKTSPRILACLTGGCYRWIGGGGERGIAVLNHAVMLSPGGLDPVIASHEMSHVELHARLDSGGDEVPQWFDEGLAVLVSGDPRYLAPETAPDRCVVSTEEALPVTLDAWLRAAGADKRTYAKAACRVSGWVTANGGPHAVPDLIQRLNAGEKFDTITKM
ncbi:hypothetical protein [Streptosporangium sp. NPDC000396]|uniref:hypothetical protein n=1 Tax=Streptosporangium sp. NPDC000396 TaxID=3366185 RepID=UPI00367B9BA2